MTHNDNPSEKLRFFIDQIINYAHQNPIHSHKDLLRNIALTRTNPYIPAPNEATHSFSNENSLKRIKNALSCVLTQYVKDCHTNLAECSDDESIEEISNHLSEIARVTRHFKEYLQVEENIENLDYPSNLLFSNSLLEAFEKIARDLFNDESYEDAANTYFLLASIRPSTPIYWLSLGIVEHKLKNHSQAIQAYVLALVNDPTLVQAHYHKGLCYLNLEQDKLAKISLDKALELLSGKEDEISLQLRNEIEAHVIYRLSK